MFNSGRGDEACKEVKCEKVIAEYETARKTLLKTRQRYLQNKIRTNHIRHKSFEETNKAQQVKVQKKIEGTKYLKRVSTCVQGLLSKTITVPPKSLKAKSFAASKKLRIRPRYMTNTSNTPMKNSTLFVSMVANDRGKWTGGPFAESVIALKAHEANKKNTSEVLQAAIKIQRNIRKFLTKLRHLKIQRTECSPSLKEELKRLREGYAKNYRSFFTVQTRPKSEIKRRNTESKDMWQERAMHVTKKARIFACIKQNYPVNAPAVIEECKAVLNSKDTKGNTPLFYAAKTGKLSLCERLIEEGVDINIRNENGNTVLHLAVINENVDLASVLIKHGADLYVKNRAGQTPLMLAKGGFLKKLGLDNLPLT